MVKTKPFWAFIAVAAMWGSSFLFIKIGLQEITPFSLVVLRTGIATLSLAASLLLINRRFPKDGHTLLKLLLVGILNPAVPYLLITWGQQFVGSGLAGIINATVPLFTLPIAYFFLRDEPITLPKISGLVIGFFGVLLIFNPGLGSSFLAASPPADSSAATRGLAGQLAMVGAAICYAGSLVVVRAKLREVSPEVVSFASQGTAFLLTAIIAIMFGSPLADNISGPVWGVIIILGISSGLSYIFFYYVLGQWGTTRTSTVTYLVPLIAVVLGAMVLEERVAWPDLLGGALVISGIILINRLPHPRLAQGAARSSSQES